MKVSLNWLKDFVDIPAEMDPRALAERFTMTTAEVEDITPIRVDAEGLVAGKVLAVEPAGEGLSAVHLGLEGRQVETVTAAAGLQVDDIVVYAPPGARLAASAVGQVQVAGRLSQGMIVPAEALGMEEARGEAVFLPPGTPPGSPVDVDLLKDWIIEIDNKSITHRPDLWGLYGIAREVAAILHVPLKPYPVVPVEQLQPGDLPEIPIEIDDPVLCRRYTGLLMTGLRPQPSPLWMQARLAHVGMRPINLIVDLTNYVMAELGQPMHAFDGEKVDRIEVAVAKPAERFTTLDGVERVMPSGALMIQSHRRSVALAGIMGGAETEVTEATEKVLLESANFDPANIRRTAAALSHRTEASARFEKSLDPNYTVLGIQRFVHLARQELPNLQLASKLSDCYPRPAEPVRIEVDLDFVSRFMGRPIEFDEARGILEAIEFRVEPVRENKMLVHVPSFRATRDVTIEADVIEEIARFVGYGNIPPTLPRVTVRTLEPDRMHDLQSRSLILLCEGRGYCEVHSYVWYDSSWLGRLGYEPGECLQLRNPAAAGQERLRRELAPGMLAFVDKNRHHRDDIRLVEIGSVFMPGRPEDLEYRHLILARASRWAEADLLRALKADLETWAEHVVGMPVSYRQVAPEKVLPWQGPHQTAEIVIAGGVVGSVTAVPLECKLRIDSHLRRWAIVMAELRLDALLEIREAPVRLGTVPMFPEVEMDFSVLAEAQQRYSDLAARIGQFEHPLAVRIWLVDSYEGPPVPEGYRSFTFRARLADPERTLTEQDLQAFREAFVNHLESLGLKLRTAESG